VLGAVLDGVQDRSCSFKGDSIGEGAKFFTNLQLRDRHGDEVRIETAERI